MKKAFSLILVIVLMLSLAVPVSAEDTHTITINNEQANSEYVYVVYQIFTGKLDDKNILTDVKWGDDINGDAFLAALKSDATLGSMFKDCTTPGEVAVALASISDHDDPVTIAFGKLAEDYLKENSGKTAAWSDTAKNFSVSGLVDGYYMVVNTTVPTGTDVHNANYSRHILHLVGDVTVNHKGDWPSVDKEIVGGAYVDDTSTGIGKDVEFKITADVANNVAYYSTYYYKFEDVMSKGLDLKAGTLKITVDGVDVTSQFVTSNTKNADGTTSINAYVNDLKALTGVTVTKDSKVIMTYTATVNRDAVILGEGDENKVRLIYSNDPNWEGDGTSIPPTGITPWSEVRTFATKLYVRKTDAAGHTLTGAAFTLTGTGVKHAWVTTMDYEEDANGTYYLLKDGRYTQEAPNATTESHYQSTTTKYKQVVNQKFVETSEEVALESYVGEDGVITFTGLGAGDYVLHESVVPSGYNSVEDIHFSIIFEEEEPGYLGENDKYAFTTNNDSQVTPLTGEYAGTFLITVENVAGTTLPSTGGMGTTLFYVFGGLMVAVAAVLLITKKRMTSVE